MCLIVVARHVHPDFPLVVAANRDEVFGRDAAGLDRWTDAQFAEGIGTTPPSSTDGVAQGMTPEGLVAGRDCTAGGTWLAVAEGGKFSAVTNVRDASPAPAALSRGRLPLLGVAGEMPDDLAPYGPANVLWGDADRLMWASNRGEPGPREVGEGVHSLSNASLDTPWPKSVAAAKAMSEVLREWSGPAAGDEALGDQGRSPEATPTWAAQLLHPLLSRDRAALDALPDTGMPITSEWFLSAPFVRMPGYGTRCQTAVAVANSGAVSIVERRFDSAGFATEVRETRVEAR